MLPRSPRYGRPALAAAILLLLTLPAGGPQAAANAAAPDQPAANAAAPDQPAANAAAPDQAAANDRPAAKAAAPDRSAPFARLPETAALAPPDRARLAAGEILAHLAPGRGSGPREGVGIAVVEAPPERVYRALSDWGHWEEFMPYLERSAAAPQPDGSVLVDQELDLPSPLGTRRFRVRGQARVEGAGAGRVWRLSWALVPGSGDIAAQRGSFALVELAPGRTLAVCRLFTDPGVSAWAADRATTKSLPWVFDGLRQHVRRSRYDAPPR